MIYLCPHCQTQNFFPPARKKLQSKVPLRCWKCGIMIKTKIKIRKKDLTLEVGECRHFAIRKKKKGKSYKKGKKLISL